MKQRPVAKVVVDPKLGLLVMPHLVGRGSYEMIYREANGLRWERERQALHAYEPSRWESCELLRHIAATLHDACDEELFFTPDTVWEGVSLELKRALAECLTLRSSGPPSASSELKR